MSDSRFEVKVVATGEVRDKDGNLVEIVQLESEPKTFNEQQLAELTDQEQ